MIAMRSCQKCHRRFDAVYPSNKTICPMCEQGEMFQGEFTDDDVFVPDVREPAEEPYRQDKKDKKKLEKLFGLNCSISWEEETDDEDDFLCGEIVLQQADEDENDFKPLLADTEAMTPIPVTAQGNRAPGGEKVKPCVAKKKRAEPVRMMRRKDPYMKGGEDN